MSGDVFICLFYRKRSASSFFSLDVVLFQTIRFKIVIYFVIKQMLFDFSRQSKAYKNENSAGKSQTFFLIYGNEVKDPNPAKL